MIVYSPPTVRTPHVTVFVAMCWPASGLLLPFNDPSLARSSTASLPLEPQFWRWDGGEPWPLLLLLLLSSFSPFSFFFMSPPPPPSAPPSRDPIFSPLPPMKPSSDAPSTISQSSDPSYTLPQKSPPESLHLWHPAPWLSYDRDSILLQKWQNISYRWAENASVVQRNCLMWVSLVQHQPWNWKATKPKSSTSTALVSTSTADDRRFLIPIHSALPFCIVVTFNWFPMCSCRFS